MANGLQKLIKSAKKASKNSRSKILRRMRVKKSGTRCGVRAEEMEERIAP